MIDTRVHARVATRPLDLIYYVEEQRGHSERVYCFGTLLDISARGARIRTAEPHLAGEKIWVLYSGASTSIRTGRVRWMRCDGVNYDCGVEFVSRSSKASGRSRPGMELPAS